MIGIYAGVNLLGDQGRMGRQRREWLLGAVIPDGDEFVRVRLVLEPIAVVGIHRPVSKLLAELLL